MKRLWLLRHAKSSWDDPDLADEDRPLASRGRQSAVAMVGHLASERVQPELVLCSSGLRARQTLAAVLPSLGGSLVVRIEPALYTFDVHRLLGRLRREDDAVNSIMLVGHNPAFQELALTLASLGADRPRLERKLPTGSLVTILLPEDSWAQIGDGGAEIVAFVTPRDLGVD
jgi:phosphohistidine phosphatase